MIRSLGVKFLLLLLSVSLISLSSALFLRQMIIQDFAEYLEGGTEDIVYGIMAAVEGSYEKNWEWSEEDLRRDITWALLMGYEMRVVDTNGELRMSTAEAIESLSPLMKRRLIAITGFSPESKPAWEGFTEYPLFLSGKNIGYLEIRPLASRNVSGRATLFLMRSNRFLLFSLLLIGGFSVMLSLIFSRKLTDPIKRLTSAARDISEGNIGSRVAVSGKDELGELAMAFNAMAANLQVHESLRRRVTANIAHELRTPITVMQAELEGMIDGLIPADRERLLSLHEETHRLKKIIEGIEELSRAEASALEHKPVPISLKPFLNHIRERYERMFQEKGVSLSLECDDSANLYGDPDKISRIVINLLINAFNATSSGGKVVIRGGSNTIEVTDTGRGIRKEDLPFIFERFYKGSEGGLGLGLAIAKELAEVHGGRIDVRSEVGRGTTFLLTVPIS